MDSFEHYLQKYTEVKGKFAVCFLCPSTVSSQTDNLWYESGQLKRHFDKNHAKKDGMAYCNVCYRSICNLGQEQQKEVHMHSSMHEMRTNRVGRSFRYCQDCCMVDPPSNHCSSHVVVEREYEKPLSDEELTVGGAISKAHCADIFMTMITGSDGSGVISGRALCNEHFEKCYRAGWTKTALPIREGKTAKCVGCKKLHAIWGCKIRDGKIQVVDEAVLKPYVVGYKMQGHQVERPVNVSIADFAKLPASEQDYYSYDPASKLFKANVGQLKKLEAAEFLESRPNAVEDDEVLG